MSFSEIWHRRLRYMLTPQWDLYKRIGEQYCKRQDGQPQPSILDYGCGTGFGMLKLMYGDCPDVVGVDSDEDVVEFANEMLGCLATVVLGDAIVPGNFAWFRQSCPDPFSVITVIEVIEHLYPSRQADLIDVLRSLLAPQGALILSTPNKRSQFRKHAGHIGVHDPASLRALLSPHFSSVTFEDYLGEPLEDDTTVSPLVAICRQPKTKE